MPSGERLLDTSIVVALLNNESVVQQRLASGVRVHVNAIVVGELMFGAEKSVRVVENVAKVSDFAKSVQVFEVSEATASLYGGLKQQLRTAGKPIPDNDLWIAATAIERHLVLVTRDKHFESIPGLTVETW